MTDWLVRVLEEVDRQYEELPEWKKSSAERLLNFSSNEDSEDAKRQAYGEAKPDRNNCRMV